MNVLVTAASKHEGTWEIALVIGETLTEAGLAVRVVRPEAVEALDDVDAVILGSGIYAGHWLPPARDLIERHAAALQGRPVWLFSSGPIGDPPKPETDPVDVEPARDRTGAREHRVFAGRIDRSRLGFGERAILAALRAPEGDFRPWPEIRAWAIGIGEELRAGGRAVSGAAVGSKG